MKTSKSVTIKLMGKSIECNLNYDAFNYRLSTIGGIILIDGYFTYNGIAFCTISRAIELFESEIIALVTKTLKSDKANWKLALSYAK